MATDDRLFWSGIPNACALTATPPIDSLAGVSLLQPPARAEGEVQARTGGGSSKHTWRTLQTRRGEISTCTACGVVRRLDGSTDGTACGGAG